MFRWIMTRLVAVAKRLSPKPEFEFTMHGGFEFRRKLAYMDPKEGAYYDYMCPNCPDQQLVRGPCGGADCNAVCPACRFNYGCLPRFYF